MKGPDWGNLLSVNKLYKFLGVQETPLAGEQCKMETGGGSEEGTGAEREETEGASTPTLSVKVKTNPHRTTNDVAGTWFRVRLWETGKSGDARGMPWPLDDVSPWDWEPPSFNVGFP